MLFGTPSALEAFRQNERILQQRSTGAGLQNLLVTKECAMLVLTRKATEKIQIGENIVLTILRVKGQAVRVGIEAPRDVRVLRTELPVEPETAVEEMKVEVSSRIRAPLASLVAAVHAG